MGKFFANIILLFLSTAGLCLILIALLLFVTNLALLITGTTVEGHVIDFKISSHGDDVFYAPVIKFSDSNHKEYIFTSGTGGKRDHYQIGQKINVIHPAGRYELAEVKSFRGLFLGALGTFIFGLIASLVSGFHVLFIFNKKKNIATVPEQYISQ